MRKMQRLVAAGATAAVVAVLGACGSSPSPPARAPWSAAPPSAGSVGSTQISDIFGPACVLLPVSGDGSPHHMVDEPVATAASHNPLVSSLLSAVRAGGLAETLYAAPALTVLAPGNDAVAALRRQLGDEQFDALLADEEQLNRILGYHVIDQRFDADGLVSAGTITPLTGGEVTVAGTADAPTFKGAGNDAPARTLCGNIPTRNATVFVIDVVLLPKAG